MLNRFAKLDRLHTTERSILYQYIRLSIRCCAVISSEKVRLFFRLRMRVQAKPTGLSNISDLSSDLGSERCLSTSTPTRSRLVGVLLCRTIFLVKFGCFSAISQQTMLQWELSRSRFTVPPPLGIFTLQFEMKVPQETEEQ